MLATWDEKLKCFNCITADLTAKNDKSCDKANDETAVDESDDEQNISSMQDASRQEFMDLVVQRDDLRRRLDYLKSVLIKTQKLQPELLNEATWQTLLNLDIQDDLKEYKAVMSKVPEIIDRPPIP
jgi:hypothetical protein